MLKHIDPDRALQIVLSRTPAARVSTVPVPDAIDLVLGETVLSDRNYPPFDRAMMDGYAVSLSDAGAEVPVVGEVAAGRTPSVEVRPGACVAIMTGAPCPPGTDVVVKKEDIERRGDRVLLPDRLTSRQHIAYEGTECREGTAALAPDTVVTPMALAVLTSIGRQEIQVYSPPRVAVISTGDELVPGGAVPGPAQIRDSNGPMLAALARRYGLRQPRMLHARDTAQSLRQTIEQAADADIVILTGGVSAGRYDLVPQVVKDLGAELVFHKVTQKPGKPLLFAQRGDQLVFGLPGNPLGAQLCFHRYVAPAARQLTGRAAEPPPVNGVLTGPLAVSSGRELFLQARVSGEEGRRDVAPIMPMGSADIFSCADANAYIRLAAGAHDLAAGAAVSFEWMGDWP